MILLVVLAVLLPWSLWRQMQVRAVTGESLIKLQLLFAGIGVLTQTGSLIPNGRAGVIALLISVTASILLGAWRGAVIPVWRAEDGSWLSQGNRQTITLWIVLIAFKFALGTVASVTGWFAAETIGQVFVTLGLSFAVQNVVVARRVVKPVPDRVRNAAILDPR